MFGRHKAVATMLVGAAALALAGCSSGGSSAS